MITHTKSILLDLITEDFCLQQFLAGMEALGFRSQHEDQLHKPVAALLGHTHISDEWLEIYCGYYTKAQLLAYHDRSALRVLAEKCLQELVLM